MQIFAIVIGVLAKARMEKIRKQKFYSQFKEKELSVQNIIKMKSAYRHPFLKLKERMEKFYAVSQDKKQRLSVFPRVKRFSDLNVQDPKDLMNICNLDDRKLEEKFKQLIQ